MWCKVRNALHYIQLLDYSCRALVAPLSAFQIREDSSEHAYVCTVTGVNHFTFGSRTQRLCVRAFTKNISFSFACVLPKFFHLQVH